VLGPLILIAVLLLVGVLVGRVVHAGRYPYEVPLGERELRVAAGPVEVRYGALVTRRVAPDEGVWVRPVDGGMLAVFESRESARVVGFVEAEVLPSSPVAAGQHR
jgi:hypothetical protein